MAAKKSEIKSEIKSDKKSVSSPAKNSRKKGVVDVAAASVVAAPVVAASVEAASVEAAPVVAAPVVAAPVESVRPGVDEARVRARAHTIFLRQGGSALDNWLRAEREIGASA